MWSRITDEAGERRRDHREEQDLSAVLRTPIGDRYRLLCSLGEDMRIRFVTRLMSSKASLKGEGWL